MRGLITLRAGDDVEAALTKLGAHDQNRSQVVRDAILKAAATMDLEHYRVGTKVPTNIYRVTPQAPEGQYVAHACRANDALLIVNALNRYTHFAGAGEADAEGWVEGSDDAGAGA